MVWTQILKIESEMLMQAAILMELMMDRLIIKPLENYQLFCQGPFIPIQLENCGY